MKNKIKVYGHCPHGENMVTCWKCKNHKYEPVLSIKNEPIISIENILKGIGVKNDPMYCYLIESVDGEWLTDSDPSYLTSNPLKAMRFEGDEGRAKAKIYLTLEKNSGCLLDFIVTEYLLTEIK